MKYNDHDADDMPKAKMGMKKPKMGMKMSKMARGRKAKMQHERKGMATPYPGRASEA